MGQSISVRVIVLKGIRRIVAGGRSPQEREVG